MDETTPLPHLGVEVGRLARDLDAVFRISEIINSIRNISLLQRELLRLIFEVIPAEKGAIVLISQVNQEPESICTWGRQPGGSPSINIERDLVHRALWERSGMQKSVFYYMRANVFITTSGVFDQAALNCAIAELGIDNILFSVDDPFGDNLEGVDFLNKTHLSNEDKEKLAHKNAERILKLSSGADSRRNPSLSLFSFKAKVKARMARTLMSFLVR